MARLYKSRYFCRHRPRAYLLSGLNILAGTITCVLLLAVSFGSTFAWYSDYAAADGSEFRTAIVKIDHLAEEEKLVYEFSTETEAVESQITLVNGMNQLSADEKDEYIKQWCLENLSADIFTAKTQKQASKWSLVLRVYSFINESDVPVYFRIGTENVSGDIPCYAKAALWSTVNSGETFWPLIGKTLKTFKYDNEYYYCPKPLHAGENITVVFAYFMLDNGTGSYTDFEISSESAEIIQAANNAVYMAEDWKNVADELYPDNAGS